MPTNVYSSDRNVYRQLPSGSAVPSGYQLAADPIPGNATIEVRIGDWIPRGVSQSVSAKAAAAPMTSEQTARAEWAAMNAQQRDAWIDEDFFVLARRVDLDQNLS